jgi:ABC-type molybdenum transport system ATPase subunit/photorepair protein PhrA
VKNTYGQELRTVIIKIMDRNNEIRSLVRAVKKVQKLRTVIIGAGSANLQFESCFSWELRDYCISSSQTSLNWLENRSQTRKKRKNTIGEELEEGELKNRAKNRRSSWCILFFIFFLCCVIV